MNPRRRRLLIPGLLVALLVVVVVAALADRADAATDGPVATIGDPRITESSGLAVSAQHEGLGYTVNDSGHAAEVFAIDLRTGAIVGVTTVRAEFRDVEALALRDGTLWIGDLGDNQAVRDDLTLYAIDEPGRESGTVEALRFPVRLEGGPADVEALLTPPDSGQLVVVTKSLAGATALALDEDELDTSRPATFTTIARDLPPIVTDGAFSPDGSRVALVTYGALWTVDPTDWSTIGGQPLPELAQTETVAFVDDRTVFIGSEGENSPLYRIGLDPREALADRPATVSTGFPTAEPSTAPAPTPVPAVEDDDAPVMLLGGAGLAGVLALTGLVVWRVRGRSSHLR